MYDENPYNNSEDGYEGSSANQNYSNDNGTDNNVSGNFDNNGYNTNNNYDEQNTGYGQYGNNQYGNNQYGNNQYGNNQYGNNQYGYNQNGQYRYSYNNVGSRAGYEEYKANKNKNQGDRKKSSGKGKKILSLVLAAVLFGVVAGGTMYGVNYAANKINPVTSSGNGNIEIPTVSMGNSYGITEYDKAASTGTMNVEAVAKAAIPAMVQFSGEITVTQQSIFGYGQSYKANTSGSGIIVGKNDTELLILTNAHVIESVENLSCTFVDNQSVGATVKGSKSDKDVAVVAVALNDISSSTLSSIAIAELGDSEDVVVGQDVVAIGNALGEGQSVTNGIISALDRSITVNNVTFDGLFMTNAAINSGNSGGALLDADGKVIGINFAKTSEYGVEGMAYSIPISNVRDLIDSLMNRKTRTKVATEEQGFLGIAAIDITSQMSSYYGYPQGIQIRTVEEGSAAEKAGLGKYDIIVSFDDQSITSMSSLQSLLTYYKTGETVAVEYYHLEGNQYVLKSVDVTLGKRN